MPNWAMGMQQTFEYYEVDPKTFTNRKRIRNITSSKINRDLESETLGSASFDMVDLIGETIIRTYLVTNQNGVEERFVLGTHIVQTPESSHDGKIRSASADAFTPLIDLKMPPPLGYSILQGDNIMNSAYLYVRDNCRAPIVKPNCDIVLENKNFVSNNNDTGLTFVNDLIKNAKYQLYSDEMGTTLFNPVQELESLAPVFTYTDDTASIIEPSHSIKHDIYGIPNVVEIVYSSARSYYYAKVENNDPLSPTSIVNRGVVQLHREINPQFSGEPTQQQIDDYAKRLLQELSTAKYRLTYRHAYTPVHLGDCVRVNITKSGVKDIIGRVVSQTISCTTGCMVDETIEYTEKLWR